MCGIIHKMGFLHLVRHRRSVRVYRQDPVPRPVLDRCLEAARLAPSACNCQPWRFFVCDTPVLRSRLAEAAFSGVFSLNRFARTAPVLIVVAAESPSLPPLLAGCARRVRFPLLDIGIACEHLLLQATEEGLGSCWIGWFNDAAVKKLLGLGRFTWVPVMLALGYPDEEATERKRKTLDEIRTYLS